MKFSSHCAPAAYGIVRRRFSLPPEEGGRFCVKEGEFKSLVESEEGPFVLGVLSFEVLFFGVMSFGGFSDTGERVPMR